MAKHASNNPGARDLEQDEDAARRRAGDELAELRARVGELDARLAEATAARQRALADFANYQRRAVESEARARQDAAASVLRSLLGVLDQLDLALDQDASRLSVEQLLGGVRIVRAELAKALEANGLAEIAVRPGDELDPHRHEAVVRMTAEGVAPGHVASVLQRGYVLGDQVVRPAKVAVAPSEES